MGWVHAELRLPDAGLHTNKNLCNKSMMSWSTKDCRADSGTQMPAKLESKRDNSASKVTIHHLVALIGLPEKAGSRQKFFAPNCRRCRDPGC